MLYRRQYFIADTKQAFEAKYTMSQHDVSTLKRRSEGLGIKENYVITHQFDDNPNAILATDL